MNINSRSRSLLYLVFRTLWTILGKLLQSIKTSDSLVPSIIFLLKMFNKHTQNETNENHEIKSSFIHIKAEIVNNYNYM